MAANVTVAGPTTVAPSPTRATPNPFSIRGTAMQPSVLLMAKLITLAFIVSGQIRLLSHHFVPFIGFFRHLGSPSVFHTALELIFLLAAASLFLNRYVRAACVVLPWLSSKLAIQQPHYQAKGKRKAEIVMGSSADQHTC